jgi:hypothetical protein
MHQLSSVEKNKRLEKLFPAPKFTGKANEWKKFTKEFCLWWDFQSIPYKHKGFYLSDCLPDYKSREVNRWIKEKEFDYDMIIETLDEENSFYKDENSLIRDFENLIFSGSGPQALEKWFARWCEKLNLLEESTEAYAKRIFLKALSQNDNLRFEFTKIIKRDNEQNQTLNVQELYKMTFNFLFANERAAKIQKVYEIKPITKKVETISVNAEKIASVSVLTTCDFCKIPGHLKKDCFKDPASPKYRKPKNPASPENPKEKGGNAKGKGGSANPQGKPDPQGKGGNGPQGKGGGNWQVGKGKGKGEISFDSKESWDKEYSKPEYKRHWDESLCFTCGTPGHQARTCPKKV